ncbi:MAG: hypothetical protein [Circular genetic element sp.]|nr:MAG: hypothetical protein [Circular genetic element sp.]
MARSKQLHYVQTTVNITQPDNPQGNWAEGVIQVDAELSQKFGRTIRNGNAFRLVGYGASLRGYNTASDIDVGFAGVASLQYCPVTMNSVGAHQKLFKAWMKQKKLSSTVGEYVRYDDFEVGWSPASLLSAGRTSTIRMEGINDSTSEQISIYGASAAGSHVTLEGFYDLLNPIAPVSKTYDGSVIKEPKFTDKFPDVCELSMPTSFSSVVDTASTPDSLGGASASGGINWLPADNHLSHLTGTLYYFFKGLPGDTAGQIADELKLTITLVYEGWSSIAPKSRKKRSSPKPKTRMKRPRRRTSRKRS